VSNTSRTLCIPGLAALALIGAACGGAAAPTTELLTARNAYAEARNGEAAKLNPTGVHAAAEALQAAEAAHKDDAGSQREKNYAYIALRRSELAIAAASEALARQEQQRAEETYKGTLEQHSEQAAAQSTQYAQQLTQTQIELQKNTQTLQQRQQELEEARIAADQAQAELRQAEAVREEEGRLIISLSGVLFEPNGDVLSKLAERRLDTVAHALGAYKDRPIVVEGYTDAQGSDSKNLELSQRRANAVREYLERRGVEPERIRAVGKGETNPVASNDTAEGRANNRRVEIIVDRDSGARSSQRSESVPESGAREKSPAASTRPSSSADGSSRREAPSASPSSQSPMPRTSPPAEEPASPRE
jgi:outer membrane protein OmpA-like peptidoglycan-associated protein